MDVVEMHERALDQTGRIVAGVRQDQLDGPTPCTDWTVRDLLNHLIGGNWNFVARAEGTAPQGDETDFAGDDPAAAYRESAEALKQAWRQPGRLEGTYQMPFGPMPGSGVLVIRLVETITHGWDLARATGQEPRYDEDLVRVAMASAGNLPSDRTGMPFGPAVEVAPDAPAVDRLAGFMGRQV